jgi:hypothetical protein
VFVKADGAVFVETRPTQVAVFVLVGRHFTDSFPQRGSGRQSLLEAARDPGPDQLATGLEDITDQRFAPDRTDSREDRLRERPVVGREELLSGHREVVDVARPADAMAAQAAADQSCSLEGSKLL